MLNTVIYSTIINILILISVLLVLSLLFHKSTTLNASKTRVKLLISLISCCILMISLFLLNNTILVSTIMPSINIKLISFSDNILLQISNTFRLFDVFGYSISYILISMLLILIIAIYYTISFEKNSIVVLVASSIIIYIGGILLVLSVNLLIIFIGYELLLLPTTYVIDSYAKTTRGHEASKSMFIWTQCGAVILFIILGILFGNSTIFITAYTSFGYSNSLTNVLMLALLIGFGTKMPIYPFYNWLPEAHTETPTSFSIILSGISIKFAFIGYFRFIYWIGVNDIYWILFVIILVGLFNALFKIDSESDIKRIVAYQTIVEIHISVAFALLDPITFLSLISYLLVTHAWISTLSFIIVDFISKRYHTRNIEHLYGILASSPNLIKLLFIIVFIFGALPGTMAFSLEVLVQVLISSQPFGILLIILVQFILVTWSKNIWWSLWGGDVLRTAYKIPFNLTTEELLLILIILTYLVQPIFIVELL